MDTILTEPQDLGYTETLPCLSGYSLNLTSNSNHSPRKRKATWKTFKKLAVRLQRKVSFSIKSEDCCRDLETVRSNQRRQVVNCFYSSTECLSPFIITSPNCNEKASRQTTESLMSRRLTIADRPCCRPCHIPPNICRSKPRVGCASPRRCMMARRSPSDDDMNNCFKQCQNQTKPAQRSRPQLIDTDDNTDNDFAKIPSQKACKARFPSPRLTDDAPRHSTDGGNEFVCQECKRRSRLSSQQRDESQQNNINMANGMQGCGHVHGCPWQAAYNNITMGMPPCFPVYPPSMNYSQQPNFTPQFPHSFPAPNSIPPNYTAMPPPGMPSQGPMGGYTGQRMPMQGCRNASSEREMRPVSGVTMSGGLGPGAWSSTAGSPGLLQPANSTMNTSGIRIQDEHFCPMGRSSLCPRNEASAPMGPIQGGNMSSSALEGACACPPGEQCACRYPPAFAKYSCSGKQAGTCCCANKNKKPPS